MKAEAAEPDTLFPPWPLPEDSTALQAVTSGRPSDSDDWSLD